jgi:SPP1 gp7 family putative phage head morphogenesis protein
MMNYWTKRQHQLKAAVERDETRLKKRLSDYYDLEFRKLEKAIAHYYQAYGEDNVIAYRKMTEALTPADYRFLMEQMDDFAAKYPQYADMLPVRASIYQLNRLEGLQQSVMLSQKRIGAVNSEQIGEHLKKQALRSANAAAETLGFGKSFYSENDQIIQEFVNRAWSGGKNFSVRIWENTDKLAEYLNTDIAQGFARGTPYEKLVANIRRRFDQVSRRDAYRLIYTEGTYVMAEAGIAPFTKDFKKYRLSPVEDGKVCAICAEVKTHVFNIEDRTPGENFPPLHPWCRCSFELVVEDWDAWQEDYVRNNRVPKDAERIIKRIANGGEGAIIKAKELLPR